MTDGVKNISVKANISPDVSSQTDYGLTANSAYESAPRHTIFFTQGGTPDSLIAATDPYWYVKSGTTETGKEGFAELGIGQNTTYNQTDSGLTAFIRAQLDSSSGEGEIKIKPSLWFVPTAEPNTPQEGMIYYDSTAQDFMFYDGSSWDSVGSGGVTLPIALIDISSYARGSLIIGGVSDWTALTKGTANQVLTSDGTDISWTDPSISDTAFASSWDAVTTIAPSKNALYDLFKDGAAGMLPHWQGYYVANGATVWSGYYGAQCSMPAADADCQIIFNIMVPKHWIWSTCYLKVAYWMNPAGSTYSVTWDVQSLAPGEVASSVGFNILSGSTSYDFPSETLREYHIHSVTLTGITAGDKISVYLASDTSNTAGLRIFDIWLSPNSGADVY